MAVIVVTCEAAFAFVLIGTIKSIDGNKIVVDVREDSKVYTFTVLNDLPVFTMSKKYKINLPGGLQALKPGLSVKLYVTGSDLVEIGVPPSKKKGK